VTESEQKDAITNRIGGFVMFLMDSAREVVPDLPKEAEVGIIFKDLRNGDIVVKIRIAVIYRDKRHEERGQAICLWRQASSSWRRVETAVVDIVTAINRSIITDMPASALDAAVDNVRRGPTRPGQ
jgi:hypothetical protein